MPSNQSVVPTLRYEEASAAVRWLANAFGLTEHFVVRNDDGQVENAQFSWRGWLVMLGDVKGDVYDLPHHLNGAARRALRSFGSDRDRRCTETVYASVAPSPSGRNVATHHVFPAGLLKRA